MTDYLVHNLFVSNEDYFFDLDKGYRVRFRVRFRVRI